MAEYIDRDALIAEFDRLGLGKYSIVERERVFSDGVRRIIAGIPAADVAPVVHGRWEWFDEETGTPLTGHEREWGWRCSHCKHELPDDYDDPDYRPMLDYCFNCGAKMDGDGNADH